MMSVLNKSFEERMWENVTEGEATGGLQRGTPSLEQIKKCQRWLIKKGRGGQAKCAESVAIIHGVWNTARLHKDKTLQMCSRCGKETETLRHRFWECCDNKKIDGGCDQIAETLRTSKKAMGKQRVMLLERRSTTAHPESRAAQSNQRR